jgi:AcrR family transcriptional regulator
MSSCLGYDRRLQPMTKTKKSASAREAEGGGTRSDAKQQTRAALLKAAARLFHDRGLDASLDEICAAAGYTRGAFYVHFKDREDLIAAVVSDTSKHRIESLIASGEGALDLERTIRMFAEAVKIGSFPGLGAVQLHQFLAAVERSEPVRLQHQRVLQMARAKLAQAVREGQLAGSVRKDVKPETVAEMLLALVGGVEMMMVFQSPVDIANAARDILRMLRPPAPRRDE